MCKYEMEYCLSYVADTILSTDGQSDKVKPEYRPFNFVERGDIMIRLISQGGRSAEGSNGFRFTRIPSV